MSAIRATFETDAPDEAFALTPVLADALTRVVTLAAEETRAGSGSLPGRLGLTLAEVASLVGWLPSLAPVVGALPAGADHRPDDEEDQLRQLLLVSRQVESEPTRQIACIMARRAMEPDHLWQDMGLDARGDLSVLIEEVFPALHGRNTANMRWKKFFYRQLCEREGFVLCAAPSCGVCRDYAACFGQEDGLSRLADLRRAAG